MVGQGGRESRGREEGQGKIRLCRDVVIPGGIEGVIEKGEEESPGETVVSVLPMNRVFEKARPAQGSDVSMGKGEGEGIWEEASRTSLFRTVNE